MRLSRRHLLALLSVPALAACSAAVPATSTPAPARTPTVAQAARPAATSALKTVQILVGFGTGNAPPQISVQQELADAYTKTKGRATIEFVRVADSTEARQRLLDAVAAGQPPDVVLPTGRYGIFLLADNDIWLDLGPMFQQSGQTISIYPKPVQDAAQAIGYYTRGGRLIGIPAGFHVHTLAYNKDLFAAAKVAPPPKAWNTAEWTYEQFREAALKLTLDESGRNATDPAFNPNVIRQWGVGNFFFATLWYAFGGRRYDPTTRTAQLDTPETRAALQLAADMINKDHVWLTDALARATAGETGQRTLWRSGKVAMVDMCSCELPGYGDVTGFSWDVAAIPRGPRRLFNFLNVDVGSLVRPGKDHETAWDVLKWMTLDQPNGRRLQVDSFGAIPSRTEDLPYFREAMGRRFRGIDLQPFEDAIPYAGGDYEDWVPNYAQVHPMTASGFDLILQGQATIADELPRLQRAVQAAIDAWFRSNQLPS